jgi:hypothetical protein
MRYPSFEKMTLGYRFDKEREIVSLVLLSYFYILLFSAIKDSGKGKGLGMAISYMIMREHKGWIEARNENGWVVFEVLLPFR